MTRVFKKGSLPMDKVYRPIFDLVACVPDWKAPIYVIVQDIGEADMIRNAISFFHGGAEMWATVDGWVVHSKGYRYYTMEGQ